MQVAVTDGLCNSLFDLGQSVKYDTGILTSTGWLSVGAVAVQ